MRRLGFAWLAPILCAACSLFGPGAEARAVLEHSYGGALDITVYVEGSDGRSLDGASVVLTDPTGDAVLLEYDASRAAFAGYAPVAEEGDYGISVRSRGSAAEIALTVPFAPLASRPVIRSIRDAAGSAYESGGQPSASESILVAWDEVDGATLYAATCSIGGVAAFSATVDSASVAIPAGSLSSGTCSFVVEAQSIVGDPLLREFDYYSASASQAPSVVCAIAP